MGNSSISNVNIIIINRWIWKKLIYISSLSEFIRLGEGSTLYFIFFWTPPESILSSGSSKRRGVLNLGSLQPVWKNLVLVSRTRWHWLTIPRMSALKDIINPGRRQRFICALCRRTLFSSPAIREAQDLLAAATHLSPSQPEDRANPLIPDRKRG